MLENQTKKFLLLSDDPADVSFLSEVAFMHHAEVEVVASVAEVCAQIATLRVDRRLLGVFVDVSSKSQLHHFEHMLQTRLGIETAIEVGRITHFISGTPILMNREVLRSPYFSSYQERIRADFKNAAEFFVASVDSSEPTTELSFDPVTRNEAFEYLRKSYLSQGGSVEWLIAFRASWDRLIDSSFPARFDLSIQFYGKRVRVSLREKSSIDVLSVPFDRLISTGVSVVSDPDRILLWIPVFQSTSEAPEAFRFMRWINEN